MNGLTREQVEKWRTEILLVGHTDPRLDERRKELNTLCDMALESLRPDSSGEAVRCAIALRKRMKEIEPKLNGAFTFLWAHNYDWPIEDNWKAEVDALDDALRSLPTLPAASGWEADAEITRLRNGLRWYADGHHFELPGWEDCSGESANWIFPPMETTEECWMVDDGGIARSILDHGHSINPNHDEDENITIAPLPAPPAEKGER